MKSLFSFLFLSIFSFQLHAQVKSETVSYTDGSTNLRGFLAYDSSSDKKRPVVFIVHEWKGLDDYAKKRALQLAEKGYLAMAVDIYGDGMVLKTTEEAGKMATSYKKDAKKLRGRMNAAYRFLKAHRYFDSKRVAAIGYCFGGTTVLEWARSGANAKGVVSFHGGLSTPMPAHRGDIDAKILVLHGAEDSYVPDAEVAAFENEMRAAKADWQLVKFGGAVHGFSRSDAGNNVKSGYAYNKSADQRSFEMMLGFFKEIFK